MDGETIKSALAQTWKNTEIVIVDDGSRNRTLEISKRFQCKAVKVIAQENQGACAARNKSYLPAQGSYIEGLDADDLLDSHKIAAQMAEAPNGTRLSRLRTGAFDSFYFSKERARFRPSGLWQDLSSAEWMITKFEESARMNPAAYLRERIRELALTLGGHLVGPGFRRKFVPVRRLMGWSAANKISRYLRDQRMSAEKAFDRWCSKPAKARSAFESRRR